MDNKTSKTTMNRRAFLSGMAAVAGSALFYPSNAKGKPKADAPNIIFIHVDQLSILDSIAAYGAKYTHTPAMDRIVRNGISFMQSYSTDPICCPARGAWWTGTYPSENGIVVNNTVCHESIPDLSPLLQQAGYNTYFAGKWHVPGKDVCSLFHVLHEGSWWGEITDQDVTHSSRAFLRNYNDNKPFFLSVGYLNPHDICITPSFDYNQASTVNGKKIPRCRQHNFLSDNDLPPLSSAHNYDHREPSIQMAKHRVKIENPIFSDWSSDLWRLHRYNYHRLVEMVDLEIGLLLDELEHSKWRDNTLIIFTSDHGEGMGRHWGVGKSTFYDEVVRVPFVVATLGEVLLVRKNLKDAKHLVSGIDFGKTVCDYAGADSSKLPHGESLRPLVQGEKVTTWRDYVYAESNVYMHMITDGRFKYVRGYEEDGELSGMPPSYKSHPIGVEQLFDLQKDPDEQNNLAYNRAHQLLLKKLQQVMNDHEDRRLPLRPVSFSQGLNWMKKHIEIVRQQKYPRKYPIN
jgi:arylsulfatase A-like enzyme